jgi:hypothetical protein
VSDGSKFNWMGQLFPSGLKVLQGLVEHPNELRRSIDKMPNCKNPLTWMIHTRMWEKGRNDHEVTFQCDPCNRQYLFKDNKMAVQ